MEDRFTLADSHSEQCEFAAQHKVGHNFSQHYHFSFSISRFPFCYCRQCCCCWWQRWVRGSSRLGGGFSFVRSRSVPPPFRGASAENDHRILIRILALFLFQIQVGVRIQTLIRNQTLELVAAKRQQQQQHRLGYEQQVSRLPVTPPLSAPDQPTSKQASSELAAWTLGSQLGPIWISFACLLFTLRRLDGNFLQQLRRRPISFSGCFSIYLSVCLTVCSSRRPSLSLLGCQINKVQNNKQTRLEAPLLSPNQANQTSIAVSLPNWTDSRDQMT